jgi:putative hydrolase of the HAD superfamily
MSLHIPDRVVVFDYGEVISHSPSERDRAELLEEADVAADPFWTSYWAHRDGLDRGTLSVEAYWRLVAADCGTQWSLSQIQRLWTKDFGSWITADAPTVDLIGELHEGGTRIALLSNAGFDFSSPFRFSPIARLFERMFISAEMDAIKPDPAIYHEVAAGLGIALTEMVFIDNRSINTEAAASLGVTVHHYTGADALRPFLVSLAH